MSADATGGKTDLDVLNPAVPKDLGTLPHAIDAVRKHVRHPIRNIYVVAPDHPKIRALCHRKHVRFVNERSVLPFGNNRFRYRSRTWERSGWLYQQLLKLNGDTVGTADHVLVVDADTVLIRPHVFLRKGKTVFYCRNWSQPEYFRTYRRLMGRRRASSRSFVTHYMLFNRKQLASLKRNIEERHGMRWYEAIWKCMDKSKPYAFSEYETCGNFVYGRNPGAIIRLPARNKKMNTDFRRLPPARIRALSLKYRSLSFHKRKAYRRKPGGRSE